MSSKHLILCHPLLLLPSIFLSIRVFYLSESGLPNGWPKYWSFSFSISPSNEYSGLISFRMDWLGLLEVWGTLNSLLQHHSSKASIPQCSVFFMVQLAHWYWYMTTGKTTGLTRRTFIGTVMSLLFNMLSKFVIAFLPRSKHLLISWLQSPFAVILEPKKSSLSLFPLLLHLFAMKWWAQMPWSSFFDCWVLSQLFHSPLSSKGSVPLCFLTWAWCHLHVWSYWWFLLEILIPACASSSPAFCMMYLAYKLSKQGDKLHPWCTPFPIWNQSLVRCLVLTVASWPAYRFLRRQVRWSGIPISKNFPQFVVIHPVKGFSL